MDLVDYSFESSVKYLSVDKNMRLPAFDGSFNFLESITPCLGYTINIKKKILNMKVIMKKHIYFFEHFRIIVFYSNLTLLPCLLLKK